MSIWSNSIILGTKVPLPETLKAYSIGNGFVYWRYPESQYGNTCIIEPYSRGAEAARENTIQYLKTAIIKRSDNRYVFFCFTEVSGRYSIFQSLYTGADGYNMGVGVYAQHIGTTSLTIDGVTISNPGYYCWVFGYAVPTREDYLPVGVFDGFVTYTPEKFAELYANAEIEYINPPEE